MKHIHYNVEKWRNRVEFLERNMATFRQILYTDDNYGEYRIEMFTCLTQHLRGLSVTELIDKGIEMEKK